MFTQRNSARGFTLLELLIVITIVAILTGFLLPVIGKTRITMARAAAQTTMDSIMNALEQYRAEFNSYPPADSPSGNGSEVLFHHLCRRIRPQVKISDGSTVASESVKGTYLDPRNFMLRNTDSATPKLVSTYGGDYFYVVLKDPDGHARTYLLIDPGADKLLGGTLNAEKGFIRDSSDQNRDGKKDDADNIFSQVQTQ